MHCTTSHQARGTISFSALSHAAAAASIVNGVVVGKLLSAPQFIRFSVAIASSLRVVGRLLIAGQFCLENLRIPRDQVNELISGGGGYTNFPGNSLIISCSAELIKCKLVAIYY